MSPKLPAQPWRPEQWLIIHPGSVSSPGVTPHPQPSPGLLQLGIQDGQAITSGAREAAGAPLSCRALARGELLVLLMLCDPWQRLPVGSEDLPLHLNHPPLRSPCRPSHCPAAVPEGPPLSSLPGHRLSPREVTTSTAFM